MKLDAQRKFKTFKVSDEHAEVYTNALIFWYALWSHVAYICKWRE